MSQQMQSDTCSKKRLFQTALSTPEKKQPSGYSIVTNVGNGKNPNCPELSLARAEEKKQKVKTARKRKKRKEVWAHQDVLDFYPPSFLPSSRVPRTCPNLKSLIASSLISCFSLLVLSEADSPPQCRVTKRPSIIAKGRPTFSRCSPCWVWARDPRHSPCCRRCSGSVRP